jgi:hypothetical protein
MSIRKVKMATAILILFNAPECGHSNGVFNKQQCLHSQKLHTKVCQKYHPEWYILTCLAQTIQFYLEEPGGLPSPTRIDLEEPGGLPSPTRINLEEPGGLTSPTRINLEESGGLPSPTRINLEEPGGLPNPTRINLFLCLSFHLSVRKG